MTDIELIRHTLATLVYRTAKTMRGAPESFATFKPGPTSMTPVQIVAHMGDMFHGVLTEAQGDPDWRQSSPLEWDQECARFFSSLKAFDDFLASGRPIQGDIIRMFQGPILDELTHTGQLAMLRRLHGHPMKGEGYDMADIVIGRVGADQTPPDPENEFD